MPLSLAIAEDEFCKALDKRGRRSTPLPAEGELFVAVSAGSDSDGAFIACDVARDEIPVDSENADDENVDNDAMPETCSPATNVSESGKLAVCVVAGCGEGTASSGVSTGWVSTGVISTSGCVFARSLPVISGRGPLACCEESGSVCAADVVSRPDLELDDPELEDTELADAVEETASLARADAIPVTGAATVGVVMVNPLAGNKSEINGRDADGLDVEGFDISGLDEASGSVLAGGFEIVVAAFARLAAEESADDEKDDDEKDDKEEEWPSSSVISVSVISMGRSGLCGTGTGTVTSGDDTASGVDGKLFLTESLAAPSFAPHGPLGNALASSFGAALKPFPGLFSGNERLLSFAGPDASCVA
jgi:hypothetical protein